MFLSPPEKWGVSRSRYAYVDNTPWNFHFRHPLQILSFESSRIFRPYFECTFLQPLPLFTSEITNRENLIGRCCSIFAWRRITLVERNQRYRVLNRAWTNPPMADFHGPSIKRGLSLPPSWEGTSLWTVLHALITTPPGWLTTPCASRRIRGLLPSLLGERSTSVSLCCSRRFKGGW